MPAGQEDVMAPKKTTPSPTGVFLCECGDEISSVIDLEALTCRLEALDQPLSVHTTPYWCSRAGRRRLREIVENEGVGAVVVAGCSFRTHGRLMAQACDDAGVNFNRCAMANLREHCARVHDGSSRAAWRKALRLVRVALERAQGGAELDPIETEVEHSVIVVGGGVTGLTTAIAVADRGIPVVLVEKEKKLGGILRNVNALFPSYCDAVEYVDDLALRASGLDNVTILTGATIESISGHVGEYCVTVEKDGGTHKLTAGCVVIATGCDALIPDGLFGYGGDGDATGKRIVTQLEFEGMLRDGLEGIERIVMIQCVGSRNEERPYCSRVCCTATVKNTITVLSATPDTEITVLTRGFAHYVGDLDRAREAGVRFVRYDPERPPEVTPEAVRVFDAISMEETSLPYDLVVLAVPLVPRAESAELAELLVLPVDDQGFVAEPRTRLRPGTFAPGGVFVAGSAHWPATVTECIAQAHGAAASVSSLIEGGSIERNPIIAYVDELTCRGCSRCVDECAHGAASVSREEDGLDVASIDTIKCVGCGVCIRTCPSSAITLAYMTQGQLLAMAEAAAV